MAKKANPKAGSKRPEPKLEQRNIDDLRPHEKQADYFADLPEEELERLMDSIRRNGLETPVQITPDNRIIKGNQRIRAAKRLGWTEIDVCVRCDLDGDEESIERELLSDNMDRRQLNPIEIARCYRRLKQIEQGRSTGNRDDKPKGDLRDRLAKKFGMSGRNLDMMEKMLDTPEEVQRAVIQKVLPMKTARKIAELDESAQRRLASDIGEHLEEGEADKQLQKQRIKGVVDQCLRENAAKFSEPRKPKMPDEKVTRFVNDLEKALDGIGCEQANRPGMQLTARLPKLKGAQNKLDKIIQDAESRSAP